MDVAKEIEQDSPEMAKLIRHLVKTSNSASYKTSILTEHLPQNGKTIETDGVSRESWNTARLSLWALLHHNDAGAALLDVIGKGGDTDSNAALTGALFGVTEGQGGLPAILENGLLKQNAKFKNPESQTNFNQRHRKGYLIYKNDDRNIKTTQRAFI